MTKPTLGNPQNTIEILQKYDFSFQKKFGQNFLIDTHVLDKIISSAEITKEDFVLEIGPGIGTMTQYLACAARQVVAVEIDKALIPILEDTLQAYDNVTVINDDVQAALQSDADGVHVGQSDMGCLHAREILGSDKIIGVSAQTVEQALLAESQGADYLGVGAMFATATKKDADDVSMETLREICAAVHIPVVAIGGVDAHTACQLGGTGIEGIAVVSALFAADDITHAAQDLRKAIDGIV